MEEAAFLTAIDLQIDHAPSAAIPVCNSNGFISALRIGPLLTKETNAHPVSAYESINTQNIQKPLQSNFK